jgi:hypothetical protein
MSVILFKLPSQGGLIRTPTAADIPPTTDTPATVTLHRIEQGMITMIAAGMDGALEI